MTLNSVSMASFLFKWEFCNYVCRILMWQQNHPYSGVQIKRNCSPLWACNLKVVVLYLKQTFLCQLVDDTICCFTVYASWNTEYFFG